jgi:NADP-dependent 3-hydroxy acid dehydrogenase YdfG
MTAPRSASTVHPALESQIARPSALAGRVAIVAGASGDIGRALALALAREGASVCLAGRDPRTLGPVAREARQLGVNVLTHPVDLTSEEEIHDLRGRVAEAFGGVDILIHAMCAYARGPHESATVDDFDHQYRTNVRAPYVLTQVLLPMLRTRAGQVVFVNSSAAFRAKAGLGQYAATKHALRALADSLRDEVNADGVRVMSVFLGRTAGARQASIFEMEGRVYRPELLLQPGDVADIVMAALRLADTAEVTEIAVRPMRKSC